MSATVIPTNLIDLGAQGAAQFLAQTQDFAAARALLVPPARYPRGQWLSVSGVDVGMQGLAR